MIPHLTRFMATVFLVFVVFSGAAAAAEPAIIAKARARLAPDAVLDAVTSIHYVGTLTGPDPSDSARQLQQSIEIFLRKPAQQRIVLTSPTVIEISALDDYDAWRRTIDAQHPERWEQTQMVVEQIRQLRADVWQNLAFFRGIERVRGRIEDEGPAEIDGVPCRKVAFYHSDSLVYLRYFSEKTGELLYTGTPENNIREHGEIVAGGIHFPKTLVISQTIDGQTTVRTITFEKISVNESLPDSLFSVPLPTVQ